MRRKLLSFVAVISVVVISVVLLTQCTTRDDAVYTRLRAHSDVIKVINTHEHQRWPEELGQHNYNFFHLMAMSYLVADVNSAGAHGYSLQQLDTLDTDALWDIYGDKLNFTRTTSYYGHFVRGFKKLYGFDDLYFTRENIRVLSDSIRKRYSDYHSWFDRAFNEAGYEVIFLDRYWDRYSTEIDERYYALVIDVSSMILQVSRRPGKGEELRTIYKAAADAGIVINTFDDYLRYCDTLIERNYRRGAVCLKNALAYQRTLSYEDVPYETAAALFSRPASSLTDAEAKKIQDFMFHWAIRKAIKLDLPIQIHTGYLAGNGNTLENSMPLKLTNLFLQYPEARFILFHGGFPWTGEFTALGKMFPNVCLDLVWLPQISRQEAVSALDVMLDCVPYNKIFWGGDCHLIEESVGSLGYAKDVVAEVLAARVRRGVLTEDVAFEIIDRIFRENAIEAFKLDDMLSRRQNQ
jgi:hypothetical protein